MKNVTKILTAVVLCAAVFASTQRVDALGGNAAFWPGDEANITNFPAQINNHGYLQVTNMNGDGHVDMVFSNGGANWSFGYNNNMHEWFDIGWGKDGMGFNIAMSASDDGSDNTVDGFVLSFGKDLGDNGELGVKYTAGEGSWVEASCSDGTSEDKAACELLGETWDNGYSGSDWAHNGFELHYRKSCGFWIFTDMVAMVDSPDEGEMTIDVDMFGHMDAGAADVMYAMGVWNHDGAMNLTANVGVEAAVTDAVTLRGGLEWDYALSNDDDMTGSSHAWTTGLGFNMGSFTADLGLTQSFWDNPMGFLSGNADNDGEALWGDVTVTYSF